MKYFDEPNVSNNYSPYASWRTHIRHGITAMFETEEMQQCISADHVKNTPGRFLAALDEYFAGCLKDPKALLTSALFEGSYDQMVHVEDDKFYSTCAHHLAPFFGVYHFAYIPNGKLVGLSKIPRLVEIFARRPQVQENLSEQIVGTFQEILEPKGCAIMMKATHFCMEARGVQAHGAITTTTAFRGCFKEPHVREEFILTAKNLSWGF